MGKEFGGMAGWSVGPLLKRIDKIQKGEAKGRGGGGALDNVQDLEMMQCFGDHNYIWTICMQVLVVYVCVCAWVQC